MLPGKWHCLSARSSARLAVGCPESTAYIDERLHVLWSQPIQEVGSERLVECVRHARQLLAPLRSEAQERQTAIVG